MLQLGVGSLFASAGDWRRIQLPPSHVFQGISSSYRSVRVERWWHIVTVGTPRCCCIETWGCVLLISTWCGSTKPRVCKRSRCWSRDWGSKGSIVASRIGTKHGSSVIITRWCVRWLLTNNFVGIRRISPAEGKRGVAARVLVHACTASVPYLISGVGTRPITAKTSGAVARHCLQRSAKEVLQLY